MASSVLGQVPSSGAARPLFLGLEQARVLNGDDRLIGERLHELDLLVGKRRNICAREREHANGSAFSQHWNAEMTPIPAARLITGSGEFAVRQNIREVNGLAFQEHTP